MVRVMILDFGGIIALWVSFIQIIACLCDLYAPNSLRPLREIISRKERKVFRKERKENAKLSLLIIMIYEMAKHRIKINLQYNILIINI